MQASDMKLGKVLSNNQLFVIPLFQRPYVWSEKRNWIPLWDDIRQAAEAAEAEWQPGEEADPTTYFLGAIVTQERRRAPQRLTSMNIIDGQQRMSTVQVLLAAARSQAVRTDCDSVAGRLESLVSNNDRAVHPDHPEDKRKLLPLPQDRAAYLWAVREPGSEVERPAEPKQLCTARDWFEAQLDDWLTVDGVDSARRLEALHFAIDERIQIVHIMLETNEDPQVIFEALNGRGEPLLPADLIKNLLFQTVDQQGEHARADDLLLNGWLPFDSSPWRDPVTTGRITRAFIDVFLGYWLTAQTAKEVSVEHLFGTFKRWLQHSGEPAAKVIKRLRADGEVFLALRGLDPRSPVGALVDSMEATLTSTPWPVLLNLRTRVGVPDSEMEIAARAIDSFIMRRAICGQTAKDYNRLFLQVLNASKEALPGEAGRVVRDMLAGQTASSRTWPSDSEFMAGLLAADLFDKQYRARMRSLLVGLENQLRSTLNEDVGAVSAKKSDLSVEHLLPQKWQDGWPTVDGTEEAATQRQDAVHRLGNLTLLTHALNPTLSNKNWAAKSAELRRQALLRLTTSSVFAAPTNGEEDWTDHEWSAVWDEERIRQRSIWLAQLAVETWPRPEGGDEVDWRSRLESPNTSESGRRTFSTTVLDLVEAGLLSPGDELVWSRPQVGDRHVCVVTNDGHLKLPDGRTKRTPSGAAIAMAGGSFDGWEVWRVPAKANQSLGDLRDDYERQVGQ
ncbi:MAG: DUF262 domain-containing protein [Actinomycetia bacterium]|nr:DUF262 domain-containing protein [Actinomycetes bacterium]